MPPEDAPEQQCDLHAPGASEGRTAPRAADGVLHKLARVREGGDDSARAAVQLVSAQT